MTLKEPAIRGPFIIEDGASPYTIRAVDRTLDILDCLQRSPGGVALAALSQVIGLPKSSVYRYLATLEARGYVVRDAQESYRLGHASGSLRPRDVSLLLGVSRRPMEELCRRFDETINLAVIDSSRVAYLAMVESSQSVRFAARPGHSDFVHSSALGKSLASRLRVDEVKRMVAIEGMPRIGPNTITVISRFLAELESVRRQGYAVNDLENDDVSRCVAVVLPGRLIAAIGLSAPAARFPLEKVPEAGSALKRGAEEIAAEVARAGV